MIIAVDFDGTIVEHQFPFIGELVPGAKEVLEAIQNEGHKIILWTCRTGAQLQDAAEYVERLGIDLHSVNYNRVDDDYGSGGIKVFAHLYIDDAALGAPKLPGRNCIDWGQVMLILKQTGVIRT